jgi:hypothetical protein
MADLWVEKSSRCKHTSTKSRLFDQVAARDVFPRAPDASAFSTEQAVAKAIIAIASTPIWPASRPGGKEVFVRGASRAVSPCKALERASPRRASPQGKVETSPGWSMNFWNSFAAQLPQNIWLSTLSAQRKDEGATRTRQMVRFPGLGTPVPEPSVHSNTCNWHGSHATLPLY